MQWQIKTSIGGENSGEVRGNLEQDLDHKVDPPIKDQLGEDEEREERHEYIVNLIKVKMY